jgi:hypothetical protein
MVGVADGSEVPVGVVGAVGGVVGPVDGVVDWLGVLGVEPEVGRVDGVVVGDPLVEPELLGVESGFCDGEVLSCVPLPPGFCGAGGLFDPLWPGSFVNTLLW